ncbi:hypothetical protein KAR91_66700 [Candidatus Pacearchaeota archaeon]|nr:hypothetical protein [Candidatus Pacearchaeota archaeon]
MKYAKYAMPMSSDMLHLAHRGLEAQVVKRIPKIIRGMQNAALKRRTDITVKCSSDIEAHYLAAIFKDYGYRVATEPKTFELYIDWREEQSPI